MKKYLLFFCILLFLSQCILVAQKISARKETNEIFLNTIKNNEDSIKVMELLNIADSYPDTSTVKLKYQLKALQISKNNNWQNGIGLCYYHLAWYYFFDGNHAKTTQSFKQVIKYSNDPQMLINSYGILSNICSWNKAPSKAFGYAKKGLEIAENSKSPSLEANAYIFLGDAYRYTNNKKEANNCYFKTLALLKKEYKPGNSLMEIVYLYTLKDGLIDFPFYILQYTIKMKMEYEKASNIDKQIWLLSLLKLGTAYNDSAKNEIIKQIELENREKQTKLYITGLVILIVMSGLLIWQNFSRKKTNEKLKTVNTKLAETNLELAKANKELEEANEIKSRFFGILNHDLRRPVAGIISYLELKKKSSKIFNEEDQATFEQKTINMTQDLLENMEGLLFWCKSQMQNFTPVYHEIMVSRLFSDTQSFFSTERVINIEYKIAHDFGIYTDINYVKTIMRNLTSNAIKALEEVENGSIEWKAYKENNRSILSITNNGATIPQDKIDILYNSSVKENIKDGLGLIIIRDLAKSINCQIKVQNCIGLITTFYMIFEDKEK